MENEEKIENVILNITEKDIIQAIKACLEVSPLINKNEILINSVYNILKSLFINDKKYVILEAPTGSGKTIIGFMVYFCVQYLDNLSNEKNQNTCRPIPPVSSLTYFLTSAKLLQEQIDTDLDRFDFRDYIFMLKGVSNYPCIVGEFTKNKSDENLTYAERPCKGLTKKQRVTMYPNCDPICPYQVARAEASEKSCTILNYAYFLNVMRSEFSPFFTPRLLTIADEAHLIPDIVCNIFNTELNQFATNQAHKFIQTLKINYNISDLIDQAEKVILSNYKIFKTKIISNDKDNITKILEYFNSVELLKEIFSAMLDDKNLVTEQATIGLNIERFEEILLKKEWFEEIFSKRFTDLFIESEQISQFDNQNVYKHTVKDLLESGMVRNNFLSKLNKGLFMSATLGNIEEYAMLMGINADEYVSFRLPSTFDFDKSPIVLTKSGWLNYKNFDSNIDKVIMDCLKICNQYHPNEKGIIHTSTFNIVELIKNKINLGLVPDKSRFLFYQNSSEKEEMVELMKNSTIPYVLIGPSLYEGLDLKDSQGRFNILIKVPYAALTNYIKVKNERYPFWYNRITLEKIVQAIGRTNRHKKDYSTVYLLDTMFDKLIWETNDSITKRIEYKKIF